ncbi:MAG: hypothetical protein AB1656_06495 [Candidatus Omnitrophota bacterium]
MIGKYCFQAARVIIILGFIIALWPLASLGGTVKIEKISFAGWTNCYRMTNGEVELIAVADIGPRIIHLGFVGGENLFNVSKNDLGLKQSDSWRSFGGHRFWIAPETVEFTYYPDMDELKVEVEGNKITLTAPPEILDQDLRKQNLGFEEIEKRMAVSSFRKNLRIRKQMIVSMTDDGEIAVEHRAENCSLEPIGMAPWALTVMRDGGTAIIPNPPFAPHGPGHFLPERAVITWSYTDLADPRLTYLKKYITIRQEPSIKQPIKIGFSDVQGWVGYATKDVLFVKRLAYDPKDSYPDMGCSVEIFTNNAILEVESLGPQKNLKPADAVSHTERWKITKIKEIDGTEESIDQAVKAAGLLK